MKIIIGIVGLFVFVSCHLDTQKQNYAETEVSESYSNGKLKIKKRLNSKMQKDGLAEEFYETGGLKKKYYYQKDTLLGEFQSFYENGNLESKGAFWKGIAIGPTFYYNKDGTLRLYNELDLSSSAYYVIKYFGDKSVEKEEGLPISTVLLVNGSERDSVRTDSNLTVWGTFSEPPGYFNKIECFVNGERKTFDQKANHLITLSVNLGERGLQKIQFVSTLLKDGTLVMKDSVSKTLLAY